MPVVKQETTLARYALSNRYSTAACLIWLHFLRATVAVLWCAKTMDTSSWPGWSAGDSVAVELKYPASTSRCRHSSAGSTRSSASTTSKKSRYSRVKSLFFVKRTFAIMSNHHSSCIYSCKLLDWGKTNKKKHNAIFKLIIVLQGIISNNLAMFFFGNWNLSGYGSSPFVLSYLLALYRCSPVKKVFVASLRICNVLA